MDLSLDQDEERPSEPGPEGSGGPGEPPGGGKRRPGRNLPVAITVGVGLGGMVLVSLFTVKEIFLAVLVVFLGIGVRELGGAFATRGINVPLVPVGLGLLAMLLSTYYEGPRGLIASFALTVLVTLVWRMPAGTDGYVRDVTAAVFTATYVPFLAGFVVLLLAAHDGPQRVVVFIATTVASDIGGFFAGTFLGNHKIAPTISPKKTWEGFSGSALACMIVGGWLLAWLLHGSVWQGVLLGAAVVCAATIGDLIESMIKRDLGIKDLGSLLPEHGGVMDRIDSLLATVPVVWLLLQAFTPPGH
jgi:phosphatidate cytidylyltransferase